MVLTDEGVQQLLVPLNSLTSLPETRVKAIQDIKHEIKINHVPSASVALLFESLRIASTHNYGPLATHGFTALNHLLSRLWKQEPKHVAKEAARTLPLVIDKLGAKDKSQTVALQALRTIHLASPLDVERFLRNTALTHKSVRVKEASLKWILEMHNEHGMPFKAYVSDLVDLLEDADGMVRDTAKTTVTELFRNATDGAKTDLKKHLKNQNVRPAIAQSITRELEPPIPMPTSAFDPFLSLADIPSDSCPPSRTTLATAKSVPNLKASLSSNRPLKLDNEDGLHPIYVNTNRELEDFFNEMHTYFEGRETEQNWLKREESMTKIRKLLRGNAAADFTDSLQSGLRGLLDGIIKAINSLRTSLSKEACTMVQDLARHLGPGMDPMVELLMQAFVKLSAATKKIASQQADDTITMILTHATYTNRILQHVSGACQDKNVQPRKYAAGWLKTLLCNAPHHKSQLEHSGALETIEKCIKTGLADANPQVREQMRATYWTFAGIWPARAESIISSLTPTAQGLLRRDANNPDPMQPASRAVLGFSKSTTAPSKPWVRDPTLVANTRSRNIPARPGSAMARVEPSAARPVTLSPGGRTPSTGSMYSRTNQSAMSGPGQAGGLSVPAKRPGGQRRHEVAPRPATAGPYSVRNKSTEQTSPGDTRTRAASPRGVDTAVKRTVLRTRPLRAATSNESSQPSPPRIAAIPGTGNTSSPQSSPRITPSKSQASSTGEQMAPARASPYALGPSPIVEPPSSLPQTLEDLGDMNHLVPKLENAKTTPTPEALTVSTSALRSGTEPDRAVADVVQLEPRWDAPLPVLVVYEDPCMEPRDSIKPTFPVPVLEDIAINEDAANIQGPEPEKHGAISPGLSNDESKLSSRLLDSGISKVQLKSLDVHGFRKLQVVIRDSKGGLTDEKLDALLSGLFEFLQSDLPHLSTEKAQDVKAQILATVKLLLKKMREGFQAHVAPGLASLLRARASYDSRSHIVSGLELLADELVTLGDASDIMRELSHMLGEMQMDLTGSRSLSMGLHVLKVLVDSRTAFVPTDAELATLASLTLRCLESAESGVRMDGVQLCVSLHARVGDRRFWDSMQGLPDDPKSLITYYIVKRRREDETVGSG